LSLERFVAFLLLTIEVLVAPFIFVTLLAPPKGLVLALQFQACPLDPLPLEVVTVEALLFLLDEGGVCASAASACAPS
jgi:hypothetical protein